MLRFAVRLKLSQCRNAHVSDRIGADSVRADLDDTWPRVARRRKDCAEIEVLYQHNEIVFTASVMMTRSGACADPTDAR